MSRIEPAFDSRRLKPVRPDPQRPAIHFAPISPKKDLWRSILLPQVGNGRRVFLAAAINGDRREEALATARPACAAAKDGPLRKLLDDRKLCGT